MWNEASSVLNAAAAGRNQSICPSVVVVVVIRTVFGAPGRRPRDDVGPGERRAGARRRDRPRSHSLSLSQASTSRAAAGSGATPACNPARECLGGCPPINQDITYYIVQYYLPVCKYNKPLTPRRALRCPQSSTILYISILLSLYFYLSPCLVTECKVCSSR